MVIEFIFARIDADARGDIFGVHMSSVKCNGYYCHLTQH